MRLALCALWAMLAGCCGPSAEEAAARDTRARRYDAAERAYARRQHPAAVEGFTAVAADPTFDPATRALARHRLGVIALREGRLDEGRRTLEAVAEFGVPERAALAALDIAASHADRGARRAATLDVARRFPDTGAAELAVERLVREVEPGEAAELAAALAALSQRHPGTTLGPVGSHWLARLQVEPMGDLPAARRTLRDLTQRWPESGEVPEALWLLAELETRRGAWRRARDTWDALAALNPDRGWIWMGSERDPKADDAALRAARVVLHGIGDVSDAIRRYRDAIDDFGDGILGDDMRFELAAALFAAGRDDEGRSALRDLIERDPKSRYAERARAILDGAPAPALDAIRPDAIRSDAIRPGGAA